MNMQALPKASEMLKFQKLHRLLTEMCAPLGSSCITTPAGQPLIVHSWELTDPATLPAAASVAHRYLNLQTGDVALLNNPAAGGTLRARPTLVTPIDLGPDAGVLLLAQRFSTEVRLQNGPLMEESGLVIPPTPIVVSGQLNTNVFDAITAHPDCPRNFGVNFERALQSLIQNKTQVELAARYLDFQIDRHTIKKHFEACRRLVAHLLSERASIEISRHTLLETGERIKLLLSINDGGIHFEFAGSEGSSRYHLTSSQTLGICISAFMSVLPLEVPLNAGVMELFSVHTPSDCFLNAKATDSTFLGTVFAAPKVAKIVTQVLESSWQLATTAGAGISECILNFHFESAGSLVDRLPAGAPASNHAPGQDAIHPWRRVADPVRVEQMERTYPIRIRRCSLRGLPVGVATPTLCGGAGLVKSYEILQPAHLSWYLDCGRDRPAGINGGRDGQAAEIRVRRADSDSVGQPLDGMGEIDLKIGDIVIVSTSSAGSFGETPAEV